MLAFPRQVCLDPAALILGMMLHDRNRLNVLLAPLNWANNWVFAFQVLSSAWMWWSLGMADGQSIL